MKSGRTLSQLAAELERQANTKKDYIADTRRLKMEVLRDNSAPKNEMVILQGVNGGMTLKPIAHQQLAASLQIPKPYYDRMLSEAPDLLSSNVNQWLEKQPATKLIRTLDGEVRAILSDSYRPLDNFDLTEAVLPQLMNLEASVESCEVTDSRLYLKCVTPRIQGSVKQGDHIQAGIVISNSEVGQGSLRLEEMDYRLVCLNGMIRGTAVRKAHLGRSTAGRDAIEDAREFFKSETRAADDRAFFLKIRDAVGAMFNQDRFNARIEQYKEAGARVITADPVKVIEVTAKRFSFNDKERSSILTHLIKGGDLSQWGLANAITRAAQDVESYDRSTEMESIGGDLIELKPGEWKTLATVHEASHA